MMRSGLALGLLVLISAAVLLSSVLPSDRVTEQIWPLRNLGKAFYENPTTHHKAVEQFEQALALNPNSARERVNYALALLRAGKTELGIAELQKVKQQAPEVPHPWFNLGIVFKKQADYEAARKQFERMVELVPDEPISHYNLGVLYKLTGEPDRALGHFETAVRLDPDPSRSVREGRPKDGSSFPRSS